MVTFAPNNIGFVYSPYNWDVSSVRAKTINTGAYFKTRIDGGATAIALNFDVSNMPTPATQIRYRIDGMYWSQPVTLAASVPLTIPTETASWAKHVVEVVVKSITELSNRWLDPQNIAAVFTSLSATGGSPVLVRPEVFGLNLLVYGDSITEGVLTIGGRTPQTDGNDIFGAWSWQMGEALGAEIGIIGFGGSGLQTGGSGNVPQLSSSYDKLWGGATPVVRSFAKAPDAIVLMEGTNDSGADTKAQVTSICNSLSSLTPSTTPIIWIRPFNGTAQEGNIKAGIAASNHPSRCFYIDSAGWYDGAEGLHPYGNTSLTSMGPKAALAVRSAIKSLTSPTNRFIKRNGLAVPIGNVTRY